MIIHFDPWKTGERVTVRDRRGIARRIVLVRPSSVSIGLNGRMRARYLFPTEQFFQVLA